MINDYTNDDVEAMTGAIFGVLGAIAVIALCALIAWAIT